VRNLTIGTPDEVPKAEREGVYAPAKEKLIGDSVANEPKNWRTSGDPKTWAEQWANEILPIAREAHTRVRFEHVHREEKDGHVFAKGEAHEIGNRLPRLVNRRRRRRTAQSRLAPGGATPKSFVAAFYFRLSAKPAKRQKKAIASLLASFSTFSG